MAERVLLHIGAPKAGTTFLQTILWKNRESLGAQGLLVPGKRRFDFNLAARSVTTRIPDTGSGKRRPPAIAAWEAIVDETLQWPGDVVISNEWFAPASRAQAERAISHWGLDQVHIVFTARAFVYQVPAAWQEKLKLGEGQSLADFTAGLDSGDQRWSWRTLDPADVLSRWGRMLPAEHVHVVTVPPRGSERELLWKRFAHLLGIDPGSCDISAAHANESMSAESARLLQLVGPLLREAIDADTAHWKEKYRWIRQYVAHELLVPRGGSRIGLPAPTVAALRERSVRCVDILTDAGYDIVGDLSELLIDDPGPGSRDPEDVADSDLLGLAVPVLADLVRRVREEAARAELASAKSPPPDGPTEGQFDADVFNPSELDPYDSLPAQG
jgi:hypothetical protein